MALKLAPECYISECQDPILTQGVSVCIRMECALHTQACG